MSENEIRVLYVQPGKYPEERTIPNTLRALQELVGGDIECCRPWRDSVCVICNDSGKIDGLPPNRLYGHTDFLAGSFVVCGNGGEDFISLTDRQVFLYERLYHMANTCPQTKEQKMQRQKARSEIANAKPKGKRQVKASQGNTSYGKMVKQDKPFVKKQNTHTEQKPTAK